MRHHFRIALLTVVAMLVGLLPALGVPAAAQQEPRFDALVFSKTAAFRHDSIPAGVAAMQQLGADNDFTVTATEDAAAFTDENLAQYEVVIWLLTTGDVLDDEQQAAFERYIRAGGGYAGIHSASDTEYDWPWYGELVGVYFSGHPRNQDGVIKVADRVHPSTAHLPALWERFDEWYSFRHSPRGDVHVLASLDESTYDPETHAMGLDHPTAWCQLYDGGRSWYTGGGHTIESYSEPDFLQHVLGGIETAAGVVASDCGGTVWANFDKVPLDTGTSNPMELDVAPDGRVFYIERAGEVRVIDPATGQTTVLADLDVFLQREDGLLGLALDPDFATNNWIYLYYSPNVAEHKQQLSRFTLEGNTLVDESVLLEVAVNREQSGHAGGSLVFDPDGNLYIATGDDTNPFASDGYAPIDERDGRLPFDAQRSSANTNDLRGKVLRITPTDAGGYTIPEGNLFAPGTASTRPEIYAMGFRNPFRIEIDPGTGTLLVADYGPDANEPDPERGPEGQVEWNYITAPGNYGWPYCHGEGPFHDWDFATETSRGEFDCDNLVNDSPNNTGLTQLPPNVDPDIYYGRLESGSNAPEMGTGGGPMAGPVYRYDADLDSDVKWPEYYDGAALFYEWTNEPNDGYTRPFDNVTWEFRLDGGQVYDINPLLTNFTYLRPMDMMFGPDGALYLIEWGTGFGGNNPDSGIYRIEYTGGGTRPIARASAEPTSGPVPLDVAFSSAGSGHPSGLDVTYHWLFGDGGESTEPNPSHTYTVAGSYTARLTVTAEDDTSATATVQITVGNTAPEVTLEAPVDGGFFDFGDQIAYQISVTDAEDGSTADGGIDCSDVQLQVSLGHAGHAHPFELLSGCSGVVQTSRDSGHAPGEDLFWVLEASYTDGGGEGVGSLTDRDLHILQPKRKEAQHFTTQSGVQLETTSDPKGGRQNIGFLDHGDYISFEPMNLLNIDAITYRVASGGIGGEIEVRVGAPDGPLVSTAVVEPTGGWQTWADVTAPIEDPGGTHELFFVFTNDSGGGGLFNLNFLKFRGKGVSLNARPEIFTVQASPTVGEQPLTVDFSADATDPEGEALTYDWDFGDGGTASGAQVSHTYELSGVYNPTVTVTDASGASASDFARVEVIPEASPPIICADPDANIGRDDEFDGDRLDGCRWDAVVRPDLNRFRVEGGQLKIDTTPTNLFDAGGNAPNLILQQFPEGDWVVETKVTGDVCERWQQGGILVYDSDRTFLKIDYVGTSQPGQECVRKIEMRHEIGDVFQPAFPEVTLPADITTWWLRLAKVGNDYTGYYSADGENFTELATVTHDPTQDPQGRQRPAPAVGVYAFGQEQTQSVTVAFDYFHVLSIDEDPGDPTDTTPPTVSATLDPPEPNGDPAPGYEGTYNTPVTVTLEATDDDSGVANVEYRLDGGDWTAYGDPFTVEDEGVHTVEFRATDNAGNTSEPESVTFEIKADACPGSDLRATVIVGTVDSGVTNRDRGDGCTINDLIEDDRDWRNKGQFLTHVRQVTNALRRDGVITRPEQNAILAAAGQSDIG